MQTEVQPTLASLRLVAGASPATSLRPLRLHVRSVAISLPATPRTSACSPATTSPAPPSPPASSKPATAVKKSNLCPVASTAYTLASPLVSSAEGGHAHLRPLLRTTGCGGQIEGDDEV